MKYSFLNKLTEDLKKLFLNNIASESYLKYNAAMSYSLEMTLK